MDINKYLIIIKSKDKTDNIMSYERNKNFIDIKFKNTEKIYTYSRSDFEFYKDPIEVDIQNYKLILNQGYVYNVIKVLKFEKYYRLFFEEGTSTVTLEYNLQLVKNNDVQTLSINKFDYYKEISKIVSIKTEEGSSLLTNEYERINFISNKTALYKYLNPRVGIDHINNNLYNLVA